MTLQPLRAVVYTRVSQDRDGTGLAVARQYEACKQLADQRGYVVLDHRSDNDISAAGTKKRPAFDQVLKDLADGRVSAVIAWDVTRLSRNARDWLRLSEAAQRAQARLIFVNGPETDMSNPVSRSMAEIANVFARMEIETKSLRQKAAREQAARAGKRVGGRRPFGYEPDGVTVRALVCVNPECADSADYDTDRNCTACGHEAMIVPGSEADAVQQGFRAFLEGVPLARIARDWNDAGFMALKNPWKGDTVRMVLKSARYAGRREYKPIDLPKGTEPELFDAQWPAIIPFETWQAVKTILADPARRYLRGKVMLLTGLAVCGVELPDGSRCGAHAVAGSVVTAKYRLYKCFAHSGHFGRKSEPIDELVETYVIARLAREDARDLLIDHDKPDVPALTLRRSTLVKRLDQLAVDFADDDLTVSQLRAATARIRVQVAEIDARLADAGKADLLGPLIEAEDVGEAWGELDTDRRREVIRAMVEVTIFPAGRGARKFDPATVEIVPKPGME